VCLQLREPSDVAYMEELLRCSLESLPAWWAKHPHGGLWKDLRTGDVRWLTETKGLVRPADLPAAPAVESVAGRAAVPVAPGAGVDRPGVGAARVGSPAVPGDGVSAGPAAPIAGGARGSDAPGR
jgi:hypothetical protein